MVQMCWSHTYLLTVTYFLRDYYFFWIYLGAALGLVTVDFRMQKQPKSIYSLESKLSFPYKRILTQTMGPNCDRDL